MAKIKYSALVTGMRNKLNGSVGSRNHYGDFWRNKTTPVNPGTSFQAAVRSRFAANSAAWRGLTEAQRNAWIAAAPNFPFTDVFGDTMTLTGNALYVKLNQNLQTMGEAAISTPPTPVSIPSLAGLSLTDTTGTITMGWTNTVSGSFKIMIYGVANISAGRNFVKNLVKLIEVDATLTTGINITSAVTDRFGSLVSGTKLTVRALVASTDSGQQGLATQASVVIS